MSFNLLSPNVPITAPLTAQIGPTVKFNAPPRSLCVQANFVYGSGGTTATVWVQTTIDGGATWTDIAAFGFALASARKIVNLNSQTPETTVIAPTDGAMAANTAQDGILGPWFRTKTTTTGTYAGGTTLSVDLAPGEVV